jgi:hypothetical protein
MCLLVARARTAGVPTGPRVATATPVHRVLEESDWADGLNTDEARRRQHATGRRRPASGRKPFRRRRRPSLRGSRRRSTPGGNLHGVPRAAKRPRVGQIQVAELIDAQAGEHRRGRDVNALPSMQGSALTETAALRATSASSLVGLNRDATGSLGHRRRGVAQLPVGERALAEPQGDSAVGVAQRPEQHERRSTAADERRPVTRSTQRARAVGVTSTGVQSRAQLGGVDPCACHADRCSLGRVPLRRCWGHLGQRRRRGSPRPTAAVGGDGGGSRS